MVIQHHDPFLWLAPEVSEGEAYAHYAESVKRSLKCFFAGNGCEDAEDLASESLLRLVEKLREGELLHGTLGAERRKYLFGIARNVLREWRRRPEAREVKLQEDEEGPVFALPPINLIAKQCLELLRQAVEQNLARLSETEQDILHQSELNPDYAPTLAMLARDRGTKAATLRQQAHRAKIHFRKLMLESERIGDLMRCLGIGTFRAQGAAV